MSFRSKSPRGPRKEGRSSESRFERGGAKPRSRFGGDKPKSKSKFGVDKPRFGKKSSKFDGDKPKRLGKREREELKKNRVKRRGPWKETAYAPTASKPQAPTSPAARPSEAFPATGQERLQKVLARCGVASRRNAEVLILEGSVTVNGRVVTELGTKVDPEKDKIKVGGKLIMTEVEPIYLALYKPKGMISSLTDPEGRRHIGHILASIRERVIPIGRLDYNSEGLLLLTNDGNLAEKILKARELPKIYMVKVKGHPLEEDLKFLNRGIFTPGGVVRVASFNVEQSLKSKSWIKLEVTEGSRLDLRELLNHRGLLVDRIIRTAIGNVSIQGLNPGEYKFLKRQELEKLLTFAKD